MKSLMSLSKGWKRIFCCKFGCFPISKLTRKQLNVPTLRFSFEFSWSWLKASSRTTRGNRANICEFKLADSSGVPGYMRVRRNTLESREHTCTHLYVHITHKNVCFGLYLQLSRHFNARRKLIISIIDVHVTPCNFRFLCFGLFYNLIQVAVTLSGWGKNDSTSSYWKCWLHLKIVNVQLQKGNMGSRDEGLVSCDTFVIVGKEGVRYNNDSNFKHWRQKRSEGGVW